MLQLRQPEREKNEVLTEQDKRAEAATTNDLNNIREKIRLQNEIFQDELRLRNPQTNKQRITANLEANRKRIEELNLKIGIETGPQINVDMDQLQTTYFFDKNIRVPKYMIEINQDLRNFHNNAGMTNEAFRQKWGYTISQVEQRLNDDEIATERFRKEFIQFRLVNDYIEKIPDRALRNQMRTLMNNKGYFNQPLTPEEEAVYDKEVTQKVNARAKDYLLLYGKIRQWEMEKAGIEIYPTAQAPAQVNIPPQANNLQQPEAPVQGKVFTLKTEVVDSNQADEILKNTEIHGAEIFLFEGGKTVKKSLTVEDLKKQGLEPKQKIIVNGVSIGISSPYYIDSDGRVAVVAYVNDGKQTVARTYYRSNSQGTWRYLPHHAYFAWYGKGYSEDSINVPIQVQKVLADVTQDPSTILQIAEPGLAFLGTARFHPRPSKYIKAEQANIYNQIKQLPAGDPKIAGLKNQINVLDAAFKEAKSREKMSYFLDVTPEGTQLKGNFYGKSKTKVPPEQMVFINPGESPNFSNKVTSWKQKTQIYGDISIEVFNSKDGNVAYMFCRDSNGRVWIGNVEQIQGKITSQGIRENWIYGGDLTTPAYEYAEQAGTYGNVANRKSSYVDMWQNYISKIPVMKEYLRAHP